MESRFKISTSLCGRSIASVDTYVAIMLRSSTCIQNTASSTTLVHYTSTLYSAHDVIIINGNRDWRVEITATKGYTRICTHVVHDTGIRTQPEY